MGLTIAFWLMAIVAVIAALGVVVLRNVFRAALSLVACFVMVSGIYVTLNADFVAAVQILVYVGAISVLIILAVMMTRDIQHGNPGNRFRVPAFIVAVLLLGALGYGLTQTQWNVSATPPSDNTTPLLAGQLFSGTGFVLPVEIAALLLLAAVIGAMVMAREK